MGAPITEAESAAIPANIKESPKLLNPRVVPKYVRMPPKAAPKTKAGEKTPPKKPMLRQITVTTSLRNSTQAIKENVKDLSMIPTIVSPPSPKTSGIKPPIKPTVTTAYIILTNSEELILLEYFCNVKSERIKITAITAHMGPRMSESETDGSNEISELVF